MLAFIATLLVGSMGTAGAQVNYTVYDGTTTNNYVPVYGLYADSYLKCEYVIPATDLTAINGSNISALTYHLSSAPAAAWTCNFQVFVKEVASSTISSFSGIDDATIVYEGTLDATSGTMVVNFTTPYQYNGGNLLIGFYNTTTGNYKSAYFYGQTISNSSVQGYNGSNPASITATQRNFIPKTTFTVDELHGCLTPTQVAVNDITTYGATVTWTPGNTETAWVVKFNDIEFTTNTPSYTATTLDPLTTYVVSVKAVCSATEESEYSTPGISFTTLPTCPAPTAVTFSNITTTSVDVAWTSHGSETAWTIDANGTEYTANSNPFTLTGLTSATSYTIMVKANCSATDESEWSTTASFTTECETNEVFPYVENFENTTFPPTCWSQTRLAGTSTSTNYPNGAWTRSTSSQGGNTTAQAKLQDDRSGNLHRLATGSHNFTYAGGYVLSVDVYRNASGTSYQTEGIRIYVNNEPTVNENATELAFIGRNYTVASTVNADIVGAETASGWYTYELPITATGVNYIIFQGESQYGSATYMDNVRLFERPACAKPTGVTVNNITSNSAEISWTNGGSETAWTISYNGTEISANSNPYPLTNLDAATTYSIMVKANCSATDESEYSNSISFTTECETFNVTENTPYEESFDGTTFPPTCWSRAHTAGSSTSYQWIRTTSSSNIHTGAGAAQLQDQSTGNRNDLVTGVLNIPAANQYQVSMWMYRSTYSYSTKYNEGVKVWVNTTPDTVGATEIGYIHREYTLAPAETATGWYEYTFVIPNAGDMYVIFQGISEYGMASYIDDISVEKAPSCLKPTDVTVSNITSNSAEISWTNGGTETAWTIMLDSTEIAVTTNPYTLTNLDAATSYSIMVKANCSTEDESEYSSPVIFTTECVSFVVTEANPFIEDFNTLTAGIPTCWDNAEGTTTNASYKWNYYITGNTGAGLRFNSYMNSTGMNNYLKTPILDLSGLTNTLVSFSYKNPTGGDFSVYYTIDGINYVEIATDLTAAADWTNAEYAVADLGGATNARIIFKGTSNYGSGDAYIYLDDVMVSNVPTCLKPTDVTILDSLTTENSAVVDWTPAGDETQWEVACNGDTTLVSAHPFTITGLSASTSYTVSVRAYCSDEDQSNWTSEVGFSTECGVVVVTEENPFVESFEGSDFGCWTVDADDDDYTWEISTSIYGETPADGNQAAAFDGSTYGGESARLISPVLDLTQVTEPTLTFAHIHEDWDGDQNVLKVYYRTDAAAEWTLLMTDSNSLDAWQVDTIVLPETSATLQIAFEGISRYGHTIGVDAVTVYGIAVETPCEVPTNLAVENNVATWESEADNFNVMYIANGDTTTVAVEGNTYTFTGLEDSTLVTVFVQAVCDETTTSDWTEGVEFMYIDTTTVGIANFSNITVKVYPNPATDVINIECNAINANLAIFDMFGKQVMNTQIQNAKTELNISALAPGVYMIRIANNNEFTTVKVVKK